MQQNIKREDPEKTSPLSGIAILVVEDDPETLALFDLFLTHMGATVAIAITVKDASKMAEEFQPDILISDLLLPDGNGYLLLDTLRKLQLGSPKLMPAIAMTGGSTQLSQPIDQQGALASGFQKLLVKPFDINELLAAIAEFTRGAEETCADYCNL